MKIYQWKTADGATRTDIESEDLIIKLVNDTLIDSCVKNTKLDSIGKHWRNNKDGINECVSNTIRGVTKWRSQDNFISPEATYQNENT